MGGDGGGPHTHDNYATKTELTNGLAGKSDDPHTHSGYANSTHTHADKADKTHTHPPQDLTHNHDGEYADAQALADHLANHPSGGDGSGGSYDDSELRTLIQGNTDAIDGKSDEGHTHADGGGDPYDDTALTARVAQNETDIAGLEAENNSQNSNIQANTDALDGKSDTTHTHDTTHNHDQEYQAKGDYATNDALTSGLAGKSNTGHQHTEYVMGEGATGLAMWIGSQAEYDAIGSKRLTTLYVVM
jgi:hypothetical protein